MPRLELIFLYSATGGGYKDWQRGILYRQSSIIKRGPSPTRPFHSMQEKYTTPEHILRDKLRKIEALFAGAATPGEKAAAGAAAERIRARLGQTATNEKSIELKFSIPDVWSRQLFIALCRRYGLRPFRHRRMHRQSIMIKAPKSFMEQVLWPEFQELNAALLAYLSEITEKVIREEVYRETGEAEEIDDPTRIGG
jgi:hypothetical protein